MEGLGGYFLAGMILLAVVVRDGLKRVRPKTQSGGWPTCRTCNSVCIERPLDAGVFDLPEKVTEYTKTYNVPTHMVRRYICPNGHVMIWYAPKVAGTEKGAFAVKRL